MKTTKQNDPTIISAARNIPPSIYKLSTSKVGTTGKIIQLSNIILQFFWISSQQETNEMIK
jgi:hypothetical protein